MAMRISILLCALGIAFAPTERTEAQSQRSDAEAAAIFDTAAVRLVALELRLITLRAEGRAAPNADVTAVTNEIAALRQLLGTTGDSTETAMILTARLTDALHARLAHLVVEQQVLSTRLGAVSARMIRLRSEEQLVRDRLRALGAAGTQ